MRSERGAISAMVVTLIVMLFMLAGLVIDGGLAINARQRLFDDAEQAARAAADQIDIDALRETGQVVLLEAEARQAAVDYMTARGYPAGQVTVQVNGDEVFVHAEDTVSTSLLQLIFIDDFSIEGQATSRPAVGITGELP
ncbi:pilus assembly protein TadG-related protein [Jiangella alkaliphila]|uniref:Putative Flp pilus-assembly TadE/G-like n=1 Tax=Jiangella alkaliphila TaxID=419479 RepID=A0A1H2JP64_9ACTN|nr:pilus assembly protein TadG-related protein [Jiangella alkaliphila]SDU58324.1 Putative Flp pilus-assembly TadE/G-like [Jiangella alkaliphila]